MNRVHTNSSGLGVNPNPNPLTRAHRREAGQQSRVLLHDVEEDRRVEEVAIPPNKK